MHFRSFLIFSVVTAIVVIVASISITSRYSSLNSGVSERPVFAGFSEKISNAGTITIKDNDKSITVKRAEDKWVLADRSNYLASAEAVRTVLIGVAELRLKEPKTERVKLYSRLEVEDVTEPNAKSRLLTIKTASNDTLAELIIGKETTEISGASDVGRYIRKPGDARSWLAEGRLTIPDSVKQWVSPQFLNVENKRINTVIVLHPDGKEMKISRISKLDKKFRIDNLPDGKEIEYQSDIDNMADGIEELELEDVRQLGEVIFNKGRIIRTTYRMFDGLIVNVEMFEDKSNKFWGTFRADTNTGANENIIKEASLINSNVSKWVYELPAYKFRYMSRKIEDVLKQPKKSESKN